LLLSGNKKKAWIDTSGSCCIVAIREYWRRSLSSLAHSIRFRYVFAMLVLIAKSSAIARSFASE